MASHTFSQKKFTPTPPDKGSFPLDHDNICKKLMLKYMNCLRINNDSNNKCREEAKNYLACRMDNDLMAKEDWTKLGFTEEQEKNDKKTINTS